MTYRLLRTATGNRCMVVVVVVASVLALLTAAAYRTGNYTAAPVVAMDLAVELLGRSLFGQGLNETDAAKLYLDVGTDVCASVVRVGRPGDGGYDVCVDHFPPRSRPGTAGVSGRDDRDNADKRRCQVFSVGIGDDASFDNELARLGCDVYSFDPTIGRKTGDTSGWLLDDRIHFYDLGLQVKAGRRPCTGKVQCKSAETRTLASLMNLTGHAGTQLDILKVDIEGDEWPVLQDLVSRVDRDCPPFKVLLAELHFARDLKLGKLLKEQCRASQQCRTSRVDMQRAGVDVLRGLREVGFEPYSRRPNWRFAELMEIGDLDVKAHSTIEMGWVHKPRRGADRAGGECAFGF